MKNTTKKLVASSIALGLAAVTSVGSALAWFTLNTDSNVTNMNMTIKTQHDLHVALDDDTEWSSELDLADLFLQSEEIDCSDGQGKPSICGGKTGVKEIIDVPLLWDAATSVDGKNFSKLDGPLKAGSISLGDPTSDRFKYVDAVEGTGGVGNHFDPTTTFVNYIEFDIHFAINVGYEILLKTTGGDDGTFFKIQNQTTGAHDAREVLRISTELKSAVNPATIWKAVPSTTITNDDPTSNRDTDDDALIKYNEVYGMNILPTDKALGIKTASAPYDQDYNFMAANVITDSSDGFKFTPSVLSSEIATKLTTLQAGALPGDYRYETIRFRVWFEGNDYSCLTDIFNQTINSQLVFTGNYVG